MKNNILLRMKDISKGFPGVQALKGVQLEVEEGEVHVLIGENGAGKSTSEEKLYANIILKKGVI